MSVNLKKIGVIFLGIVLFCLMAVWIIFNTSFGNELLKNYFQKEVNRYFPSFRVEKFKAHYNHFSMILKDGINYYKLAGKIYPFNAVLEGNIKEIKIADKVIKDNIILSGNVVKDKKTEEYVVNSDVYFSDNRGFLKMRLGKSKMVSFSTKNADVKYLLQKFNFPHVRVKEIKIDMDLSNEKYNYVGKTFIKIVYKDRVLNSHIHFHFNTLDNIYLKGDIKGNNVEGKFVANVYKENIVYDVNFDKFDLSLLDFVYPFRGVVPLEIKKDKENIFRFSSTYFKGFKDKKLNIQFTMPVDKFFYYLSLNNIFKKGSVTGRIEIDKKGYFNFLIQNAILKKSIAKKLGLKVNFFEKIFVNGSFDKNKIVFDLLSDSKNITVSIKNGVIYVDKNLSPKFIIVINDGRKELYYKFENNRLRFFKKRILKERENKVLVF